MRHSPFVIVPLLAGGLLSGGAPCAQTTLDLHALDALPGGGAPPASAPSSAPPTSGAATHPAHPLKKPAKPKASAAAKPKPETPEAASLPAKPTQPSKPTVAPTAPPAATIGPAPPAAVIIPPAVPTPPTHPAPPPTPPPIAADAGTEATPIAGGLRVTFPKDTSNITPETETALRDLATPRAGEEPTYNVLAYAAGVPEDPSTPRRLSLARALAARSVLIAAGIPSTRIYVRALGASASEGPSDRVDVILGASQAGGQGGAPAGTKP